ncbi:kinase-like domain-containing protein [Mycena sp. CBHHK59/15]|nr:kinase-like domain-containing protein [Mycena sp. CBHHK59/15]
MFNQAAGLVHLHRLGIIHKDIKPENILISAAGHCVIADYGACEISLNSTEYGLDVRKAPGECIETPGFTAPETQYYGLGGFTTFDERVDYWSLGMTMYSLITGWRPPNDATSLTHAQMGLDGFSKMYKNMADCPHDIRILVIKVCPKAALSQ